MLAANGQRHERHERAQPQAAGDPRPHGSFLGQYPAAPARGPSRARGPREDGACNIIDLKRIPLAPGEQEAILATLGEGEVRAELQSLGRSEIHETSYPGVWVVTHYDEQGDIKARFIEITRMPDILESQAPDIAEGLARLESLLHTK